MLLGLLTYWTVLFLIWPLRQDTIGASFLHIISIPFHEAGHLLFAPFGNMWAAFGGSLMQVLVPLICLIAFLTTSYNPFGAAVMLWWLGENLSDVAMYIADARALNLVLLGGQTGAEVEGHDWNRILSQLGWFDRDIQIARTVHLVGAVMMLGGLVWAAVLLFRQRRRRETV